MREIRYSFMILIGLSVIACYPPQTTNTNTAKQSNTQPSSNTVSSAENKNTSQKVEPTPNTTNSNPTQAKAIEKYLADNFGIRGAQTSWYGSITGISVEGDAVLVKTNLRAAADPKLSGICSGVSGYIYAIQNRSAGIQKIQIFGSNGNLIFTRSSVADKCYV